jgi:hypothetical protein
MALGTRDLHVRSQRVGTVKIGSENRKVKTGTTEIDTVNTGTVKTDK